jgi:hypothetical protein
MKYFLFLLSFFILFSCSTGKEVPNAVKNENIKVDSLVQQSDSIKIRKEVSEDPVREENEMMIIDNPDLRTLNYRQQNTVISKHEKKTNLTVIDKSIKTTTIDTTRGWIAFSVPEKMTVGKTYSIKVRISKKTSNQNRAILILGNEDAINNPDYSSIVTIEDINVSGEMTADLRGDSEDFSIEALSTPTQSIDTVDYTEWEWTIKPKTSGMSPLKLLIRVKDLNKDIVVFNKTIKVKSNVSVEVGGFFSQNWQWFMTTIIIPVFLYFWNRKKKRKTKKS